MPAIIYETTVLNHADEKNSSDNILYVYIMLLALRERKRQ